MITLLPRDDVHDGLRTYLIFVFDTGNEFDSFRLTKSTYESAAREGGFEGELTWKSVELPDEEVKNLNYWQTCLSIPYFGNLIISKNCELSRG